MAATARFGNSEDEVCRRHEPWVEKYRPDTVPDIRGQREIVSLFENTLNRNQVLHFLFHGPPGTGKTSMILSFCRDIYEEKQWMTHVLEINASYDRGIDMVRDKIKTFCKKSITPFVRNGRKIHYKFVILDEADTLTNDAQNSLRRCIEIYSYNTRFCFLCNYPSKIIAPILSRCCVCHFQPIAQPDALEQMRYICTQESLACDEATLQKIYAHSRGDLRTCVSSLQALWFLYGRADAQSFRNYTRVFPHNVWETVRNASVSDLPRIADGVYLSAHSMRSTIASLITWTLQHYGGAGDDCCDSMYRLSCELSRMERQIQYCADVRLFIMSIIQRAWLFMRDMSVAYTDDAPSAKEDGVDEA